MRYLNNNRFPGSHVPIWRRRIRMRVVAGKGKWPEAKQRIEIRREKIEGRVDIPVSFSHARVRHTDLRTKRARLDRFRDYAKIICMTMKYDRLLDSLAGRPKKCTPALKNLWEIEHSGQKRAWHRLSIVLCKFNSHC